MLGIHYDLLELLGHGPRRFEDWTALLFLWDHGFLSLTRPDGSHVRLEEPGPAIAELTDYGRRTLTNYQRRS